MGDSESADTSAQLQGNERNDRCVHHQKYPKGSLMLKGHDSEELKGFSNNSSVCTVQWSDNVEDLLTEYLIGKLTVDLPGCDISQQKWIPFKGQNVYVTVDKTLYEVTIKSPVPEKQHHAVVQCQWDINNEGKQFTSRMSPH